MCDIGSVICARTFDEDTNRVNRAGAESDQKLWMPLMILLLNSRSQSSCKANKANGSIGQQYSEQFLAKTMIFG